MSKARLQYVCQACGYASPKWLGRCPACEAWNSLVEEVAGEPGSPPPAPPAVPVAMTEVVSTSQPRMATGSAELDRVLGGALFIYTLSAGLGFMIPDFWLGNRIKKRQLKIRLGLPEALDLMVICTEAGLGLDQAMNRVSDELKVSQPEIREELVLVNLEQKAGRPRDEALKNFADRADIDSVRALTTTLIQADTFGTSIAKTLRVYSDTLRTQRRQQAEELAAKTTVKLVFPLVLFIFPSIFVVALGPSAITLMEGMSKFFG